MCSGKFLRIHPHELQFPCSLSCTNNYRTMQISNKSDNYVAFEVKVTDPNKYYVQPKTGIVLPNSTCHILVMVKSKVAPADMPCNDEFRVLSVIISPESVIKEVTSDMFEKESGNLVDEYKLRVAFISPLQHVPATVQEASGKWLSIHPQELQFPTVLNKQVSCSMQLSNKTDNYVAFKVKTSNPKMYCVRPNFGIILPYSSSNILVTRQAQKERPEDMECNDKFLVQSVITSPNSTISDITSHMFNKDSGNQVDEYKWKVVFVLPPIVHEVPNGGSAVKRSMLENTSRALFQAHNDLTLAKAEISRVTEEKMLAIQQKDKLKQELDGLRPKTKKEYSDVTVVLIILAL